uniref:CLIP domain-containing serine protease n=1 Tax=Sipha flava TaxID=143950 RepID=A0A2S2Q5Y0_9HEMI
MLNSTHRDIKEHYSPNTNIFILIIVSNVFRVYITILIFLFLECFTPNDLNGVCINIKRCPSLLMLLENQRKNSTIAAFLRNSMCGYEGRDPKVCCALDSETNNNPSQNIPPPTTTVRPNTSFGSDNVETVKSSKLPSQSTCGKSNSSHIRIVGGIPADLGAWPWMAALGYQNLNRPGRDYQWLCGGALISDRYALTAAHCTVGIGNRKLVVVHLGDLDLNPDVQDSASPIDVPISRIITHERYNAREYTNDIALLKLESTVRFNELIQPICLPILQKHRSNQLVSLVPFVAGWGSTSFNGGS